MVSSFIYPLALLWKGQKTCWTSGVSRQLIIFLFTPVVSSPLIPNAFRTGISPQDTGKLAEKGKKYLPELVREKRGGTLPPPGGIIGYTHFKYNTWKMVMQRARQNKFAAHQKDRRILAQPGLYFTTFIRMA